MSNLSKVAGSQGIAANEQVSGGAEGREGREGKNAAQTPP